MSQTPTQTMPDGDLPGPSPIPATASLVDIDAAPDGTVAVVTTDGEVLRRVPEAPDWSPLRGWPPVRRVSVASASALWAVDDAGGPCRLTSSGGCDRLSGDLIDISAGSDGAVYGVSRSGGATRYRAETGTWAPMPDAPGDLRSISVGSGDLLVAIDGAGTLHCFRTADGWQPLPGGPFASAKVTADGLIAAATTDGAAVLTVPDSTTSFPLRESVRVITAGGRGEVWAIDTDGHAADIAVGGSLFAEIEPRFDSDRVGWDAQDVFDDTKSTHLWIVNCAARLAAEDLSPAGRQIYDLIKPGQPKLGDPFHDRLCQGLYDADYVSPYNGPLWTYAGHFYDPDTGENWLGGKSNTAFTNFLQSCDFARRNLVKPDSQTHPRVLPPPMRAIAGFSLGLALHYLTDVTQPMHASNFTQLSSHPINWYHGAVETLAMELQGTVPPPAFLSPATGPVNDNDLGQYLIAAAKNAKSRYADMLIDDARTSYRGWDQNPTHWRKVVTTLLQPMLQDAIRYTAQFLIGWMENVKRAADYFDDAYGPEWQLDDGYLTEIAVGQDGSVWGVGLQQPSNGDNVFRWDGSWKLHAGVHLTQIAVAADGNVWGVNSQLPAGQSNIFHWNGSTWQRIDGYLTCIAATADGDVWGVNARIPSSTDNIFHWTGTGWERKIPGYLTDIAIGPDRSLWGVNTKPTRLNTMSNVFHRVGSEWVLVGDKFLTSVCPATDGRVWGVDATQFAGGSNVCSLNGKAWTTEKAYLTRVASGGDGRVWGVNANHVFGHKPRTNIFRRAAR